LMINQRLHEIAVTTKSVKLILRQWPHAS
jgi:hypothetical protein